MTAWTGYTRSHGVTFFKFKFGMVYAIFRIGTVDVLKAYDACADIGQLQRSVPIL